MWNQVLGSETGRWWIWRPIVLPRVPTVILKCSEKFGATKKKSWKIRKKKRWTCQKWTFLNHCWEHGPQAANSKPNTCEVVYQMCVFLVPVLFTALTREQRSETVSNQMRTKRVHEAENLLTGPAQNKAINYVWFRWFFFFLFLPPLNNRMCALVISVT